MPRIRYIKPGFFLNEEIAELDPLARLTFIGLWCQADRVGRVVDRPRRLKTQILPYDADVDLDEVFDLLTAAGFILRYTADGQSVIQIINFDKHQKPHPKEAEAGLPPPNSCEPPATLLPAVECNGSSRASREKVVSGRVGNGEWGMGKEGGGPGEGDPASSGRSADEAGGKRSGRKRGRPKVPRHPETEPLCEHLASSARGWKPSVKLDSSARSLDGMDGLVRIDNREPDKVRRVISWLFRDYEPVDPVAFDWRPNILSGHSLRRSWDKIESLHDTVTAQPSEEWV